MQTLQMIIDGQPVPSESGQTFETLDPSRNEPWALVPAATGKDVDAAVRAAARAFEETWWRDDPRRRADVLDNLARLTDENVERLAQIESRDNGKPIRECRAVMQGSSAYLRYQAAIARTAETGQVVQGANPATIAYNVLEPWGVIAVQVPWNTPVQLMVKSISSALAAGNTIVVKPSEFASASVIEFVAMAGDSGLPPGVLNVVTGLGSVVGEALCAHPSVARIVLTGGPEAGRIVARHAADRLVPVTLELGGKSPNIIFDDADLESAVPGLVGGFTGGAGQSCVCGSRALVQASIYDDVLRRLTSALDGVVVGEPSNPASHMGPLCTPGQHDRSRTMVAQALRDGATLAYGAPPDEPDPLGPLYFGPRVLADVDMSMQIAQEEVFGPVLCLIPFSDEKDALNKANDTRYGLAAGVWTNDVNRINRMVRRLRAGMVWVNDYRSGDPAYPFGGYGESGYGRANGRVAYEEMSQLKSVQMRFQGWPN